MADLPPGGPPGAPPPVNQFIVIPVEKDFVTLLTLTPQGAIAVTKVEHEKLIIVGRTSGDGGLSKGTQQLLAYIFAAILVIAILALAILVPDPKPFQYTVFRIVLAFAIAGVAAMLPGFLDVVISTWLRAGGALAVFVIVYFFSPAQLLVNGQVQHGIAAPPISSPTHSP